MSSMEKNVQSLTGQESLGKSMSEEKRETNKPNATHKKNKNETIEELGD